MYKQKAVGVLLCLMLCLGLLFSSGFVAKAEAFRNIDFSPEPESTPDPISLGIEPFGKGVAKSEPPTGTPPSTPYDQFIYDPNKTYPLTIKKVCPTDPYQEFRFSLKLTTMYENHSANTLRMSARENGIQWKVLDKDGTLRLKGEIGKDYSNFKNYMIFETERDLLDYAETFYKLISNSESDEPIISNIVEFNDDWNDWNGYYLARYTEEDYVYAEPYHGKWRLNIPWGTVTLDFSLRDGEEFILDGLCGLVEYEILEDPYEPDLYQTKIDVNAPITPEMKPEDVLTINEAERSVRGLIVGQTYVTYTNNELITISGNKTWDDNDNGQNLRPESITIELYGEANDDGQPVKTKIVSESDGWSWRFENLPSLDQWGKIIDYRIIEEPVKNYEGQINGYNITNKINPGYFSLPVVKVWEDEDDRDGLRPDEVEIQLIANGMPQPNMILTLSEENHWEGVFEHLLLVDQNGPIKYEIQERTVRDGYQSSVVTHGDQEHSDQNHSFSVINKHDVETTDVSVRKEWKDENNKDGTRPEFVTVFLLANEVSVADQTLTLSEENQWSGVFRDIPKNQDGKPIEYSVGEVGNPLGYNLTITVETDGTVILTNEYQPTTEPTKVPNGPEFYRLERELPRTGITGYLQRQKPASIQYKPLNMDLLIPSLNVESPIVVVKEDENGYPIEWLGENAGLLADTSIPGEGQSVIAAHNTLNAEEYGPFAMLATLHAGEKIFIRTADNRLLSYEVYANEKVGAYDEAALKRISDEDPRSLALITCEDERIEGGYENRRIIGAKPTGW